MEFCQRKQNRFPEYDYGTNGAYFVTICTQDRRKILSEIVGDGFPVPKPIGLIAEEFILKIPKKYPVVSVDRYMIMPDHIHILLMIEAGTEQITYIPSFVCNGAESLQSVSIGKKVTSIGMCAFASCESLESVTLPASLTAISGSAFMGCFKLETIIFEGTVEQWNQVTKADKWNDYCPATVVQCSDGQVPIV